MNHKTTDLTTGNPSTVLWRFCLPLFGSVIFQQLYNVADSLIAGQFIGENALAAVGNSYEITLIFIAFAMGCNMACSVITIFRRLATIEADDERRPEPKALFDVAIFRNFLSLAIPSVLQQGSISIASILAQSSINDCGVGVTAGFAAGIKLHHFTF